MQKVFIKTYGCSFNQLDSQIMLSNLSKDNYEITDTDKDAELIIINSCTVKNSAETKLFNDIKKYKEQNKELIIAGCIPQAQQSYLQTKLKDFSVIGINDLDKINYVANQTLKNPNQPTQIVSQLQNRKANEEDRKQKENLRLLSNQNQLHNLAAIIPINEGCLNKCTYCKTVQARGTLFSYSIDNIKQCMQNAINKGAKEIFLTSQDVACYGKDIQTDLPTLLKELIKIEGDYKIRIGMGNPNHFIKIIDEVLEIMNSTNKIYKFLHIPLQAASNRILKEMRRGYTYEEYQKIITKIRQSDPKITIANDIIVAYPTETQEEFEKTLQSLPSTNVLNFSRFWLRPNTPVETLYTKDQFIKGLESKNRAKKIKEVFEIQAKKENSKWINWQGEAIILEKGKKGTNSVIARNQYYKPIVIQNCNLKLGTKVKLKIIEVTWYDFRAELA